MLSWLRHLTNLERKAGLEPALSTLATSRLSHWTTSALTNLWSEQRELNSRHRVGGPRHQPLYHARSLAGDEGLEPSLLDLEASVLAARRISRKLMAELTGIEPVPADRQSAILPIDHSSGSLPWIRTTISAFRAQRPAIGRRGNLNCQRTGCRGAIRTPVPGFKVQGPATRRPGITPSARLLSCTVCTTPPTHRRCGPVFCDPYAHDPPIRRGLLHGRSRVPTQARSQSLRVQLPVCS